ncbi:protein YIF1B isoform X1 [Macrosteles quadrilineatus]|uniref:protein YIF1B isoform X1 n=1 Tax=Macrosteles quadrilineatus TaxID=74068 RepID=UPI0023E34810|nr:protein YIF1B isoform X1 [Macrosteles quadrilineatus]
MNFNSAGPRYPPGRKLSKRPTETPGLESTQTFSPPPAYNPYDDPQQYNNMPAYPPNQFGPGPGSDYGPGGPIMGSAGHGPGGVAMGPAGYGPGGPAMGAAGYGPAGPAMGPQDYGPRGPNMMPTQLFSDPLVANVAMSYGSKIVDSGKEIVDREINKYVPVSTLKYYFAVDTNYVMRKLKLLFFPFTHNDWSVKYEQNEPVQPRYEVNAPDLYIPTMAYVTYVLVAGLALGTQNRFAPEVLGVLASSALAWSVVEILVALVTLYITNIQTKLKTFDLIAYAGYKYVGIITAVLLSIVLNKTGYYIGLIYCGFSLAIFMMRSLKWQVLAEVTSTQEYSGYGGGGGNKRRLYFLLFTAGLQPLLMWWLSAHLVPPPLPPVPPNLMSQ